MNAAAPRDIDDDAVAWAVRLDADDLATEESAAFQAWLASDPRHSGALLRAEAGLSLLSAAPGAAAATRPRASSWRSWRGPLIGAAFSAFAAAAVLMVALPGPGVYATAIGEQRRVALDDGSIALVNTDSRVRVQFSAGERRIRLDEGEAWFQVAKNPDRPFVVDVGNIHVRATGTAFSVRRRGEGAEVVVTEGTVRVWRDDGAADAARVSAGQAARLDATSAPRIDTQAGDAALAWRRGELVLDRMTVGQAAEELNRYNTRKIIISDPAIASHRMVGLLLINKPEEFAQAVAQVTGRKLSDSGRSIEIGTPN